MISRDADANRLKRICTDADYSWLNCLVHDINVVMAGQKIVFGDARWACVVTRCFPSKCQGARRDKDQNSRCNGPQNNFALVSDNNNQNHQDAKQEDADQEDGNNQNVEDLDMNNNNTNNNEDDIEKDD